MRVCVERRLSHNEELGLLLPSQVDNHHNQLRDNFQFLRQHFFAAHPEIYGDLKAEGVAEALFAQVWWWW